jgi:hypothetical protein
MFLLVSGSYSRASPGAAKRGRRKAGGNTFRDDLKDFPAALV